MTLDERVLALVGDGRWRLLSGIAETLGVPRRSVEETIEVLRVGGHPIVGGDQGVKLTADPMELRGYIHSRRNRALAIARGTRELRRTANRLEGRAVDQRTLWREVA